MEQAALEQAQLFLQRGDSTRQRGSPAGPERTPAGPARNARPLELVASASESEVPEVGTGLVTQPAPTTPGGAPVRVDAVLDAAPLTRLVAGGQPADRVRGASPYRGTLPRAAGRAHRRRGHGRTREHFIFTWTAGEIELGSKPLEPAKVRRVES